MSLLYIQIQCPSGDICDAHEQLIPQFPLMATPISWFAKKEWNRFVNSLVDKFAVILLKMKLDGCSDIDVERWWDYITVHMFNKLESTIRIMWQLNRKTRCLLTNNLYSKSHKKSSKNLDSREIDRCFVVSFCLTSTPS